jgi:hypothetical protein
MAAVDVFLFDEREGLTNGPGRTDHDSASRRKKVFDQQSLYRLVFDDKDATTT